MLKYVKLYKSIEKINKKSIDNLNIRNNVIDILKANKIKNIGQLCKKSKANLKRIEIVTNDIIKIEIELQLLCLNLKNSL